MYNHIMACKNLGLQVSSDILTPVDLDLLVHIQSQIDKAHDDKRKRSTKKR